MVRRCLPLVQSGARLVMLDPEREDRSSASDATLLRRTIKTLAVEDDRVEPVGAVVIPYHQRSTVETTFHDQEQVWDARSCYGFSTSVYDRWFDNKYGREMTKAQWVKAHVMIGVKTNVVTSVEITDGQASDAGQFHGPCGPHGRELSHGARLSGQGVLQPDEPLHDPLPRGRTVHPVQEERAHLRARRVGPGAPVFPRKPRAVLAALPSAVERRDDLPHDQVQVGTRVRAKTPVAQVNEVLAKVLCHNLCCLVSAAFKLGVEATFWQASVA
jgi:hypothetical protein